MYSNNWCRCSPCPDSEGIETHSHSPWPVIMAGCSPCPDSEGIETFDHALEHVSHIERCSPCPDSEGIETDSIRRRLRALSHVAAHAPIQRGLKPLSIGEARSPVTRCSPCPDSEGIETCYVTCQELWRQVVAAHAPIQRGLKRLPTVLAATHGGWLQPMPRFRGD